MCTIICPDRPPVRSACVLPQHYVRTPVGSACNPHLTQRGLIIHRGFCSVSPQQKIGHGLRRLCSIVFWSGPCSHACLYYPTVGQESQISPSLLPYSCLRALRSSNGTFRLGRILSEGWEDRVAWETLHDLHQRSPPRPVWFLQRHNTCLHVSWSRSNSGYVLSVVADPPYPALGSLQSAE